MRTRLKRLLSFAATRWIRALLERTREVAALAERADTSTAELREAKGRVRADLPLLGALLWIVSSVMLREASGPLKLPLWGGGDDSQRLAEALFLGR